MSKGLAGVKTPTAKQIADKWKLPLAIVAKKIAAGVKVEKEHTTSLRQANEIARDHLGERPDYYEKLHKMEKTKIVKEESTTSGVSGLGFVSGTPAVGVNDYINTNAMSYYDENGNRLDNFVKAHTHLHNSHIGYNAFSPKKIGAHKNFHHQIHEAKLNELGEYDNKGGSPGYEATSASIRAVRKRDVEEQSPANPSYKERPMYEKSTGNNPVPAGVERGIYEISAELVGKVSNARFFRGEAASKTLNRAIIKKFIESDKKKEQSKTVKEETKMDTKELINEALDCVLEDNLSEMKDNLMLALQEKAMEKLEERKKEIAANYFAQ